MPMNPYSLSATIILYRRDPLDRKEIRTPFSRAPLSRRERKRTDRGSSSKHIACVALFIASCLWTQTALADNPLLRGPRHIVRQHADAAEPSVARTGILERIAEAPVLFYQRFLGTSWVRRCSYYPSCSNYALLAIRKHGAVLGSIMAFDRLQHEADEVRFSPLIVSGGEIKGYDPLENNDYWWYRATRPEPATSATTHEEVKP
jgi:putative component of membrane protein insertase Oxa1/YidC/SpoIIIJ protein YidD